MNASKLFVWGILDDASVPHCISAPHFEGFFWILYEWECKWKTFSCACICALLWFCDNAILVVWSTRTIRDCDQLIDVIEGNGSNNYAQQVNYNIKLRQSCTLISWLNNTEIFCIVFMKEYNWKQPTEALGRDQTSRNQMQSSDAESLLRTKILSLFRSTAE